MKNQTVRRSRKTKVPVWIFLLVIVCLGTLFGFQIWLESPHPPHFVAPAVRTIVTPPTVPARLQNESLAGVEPISTPAGVANISGSSSVAERFLPVEIACEGQVIGKGVLFTNRSGQLRVGTVAHLFPEDRPAVHYTYRIMSGSDTNQYSISAVEKVTTQTIQPVGGGMAKMVDTEVDLVVCHSGESVPIKGVSPFKPGVKTGAVEKVFIMERHSKLVSVHTKKVVNSSAVMVNNQFSEIPVFVYPHRPGDSGEGFTNENGGLFFLLGGGIFTNITPDLSGEMSRAIRLVNIDKY